MPSATTWDEDIADVGRCLAGDGEAFSAIVLRHQGLIRAHVRTIVGPVTADDVAQEAFIRAWQALARYDPAYPFRAWLLVIATRLAINRATRGPRWSSLDEAPDPATADAGGPDREELGARIKQALTGLGASDRALFAMRFQQELAPALIAEILGVSEGAIKVRVHRLRQRLAPLLAPDPGRPPT